MNRTERSAALVGAGFSCLAAACGGSDAGHVAARSASPPAAVEARFTELQGPLGCAESTSALPPPPDGCDGATALVDSARREYRALFEAGGSTGEAPDLEENLQQYERDFAAQHPFEAHTVTRDGFTIAAREFGADHDGPVVLLMHGFPDNQHLYDAVAPVLGEKVRTITFDFVGWGDSTHPPADHVYTVDSLRADVDAVVNYFHLDDVVPVVHDASGWPGIDWALDNEARVRTLVLLNTVYNATPGTAPPNVIRALGSPDLRPAFIEAAGDDALMTRALFRGQVGQFFTDPTAKAKYLPVLEARIAASRPGLYGLTDGLLDIVLSRNASLPRMSAFSKRVVIGFGADDRYLNTQVAQAFAEAFSTSTLTFISGANHYVQLDKPSAVAELILGAAQGS